MIKNLAIAVLMLLTAGTVGAQTTETKETVEYSKDKHRVETNHFWDNWFIGAGGGVQVYFGDHDNRMSFGDRFAPALDITVGKWFTPSIGARLMYSGLSYIGLTQTGVHSTGEEYDAKNWLDKQKFNMFNIHADMLFNLNSIIGGYNPERVWSISPYLGVGWMHSWGDPRNSSMCGTMGLLNAIRLCDALDFNIDIRGVLGNDNFDGENGGRQGEGALCATIGLSYKFNKRGWDRGKTVTKYKYSDLSGVQRQIDSLNSENRKLHDALAQKSIDTVVLTKTVISPMLITFAYGKSELSNEARANVGLLAEVLKNSEQATYTITGYADAGTGNKQTNKQLSRDRAKAVYDCLVNEFGVPASKLVLDYKGGVENMFYDDPRLSRAVITACKQ